MSMHCNYVKKKRQMDFDWLSICLWFISYKKSYSESDSNDIVLLLLLLYNCGVDCTILIELQ